MNAIVRPSLLSVLCLVVACVALTVPASAEDADPIVLFFHDAECPDCEVIAGLLDELLVGMPEGAMRAIEIGEPGAVELLGSLCTAYGVEAANVPVVFVSDEVIVGAGRAEEFQLRAAIGDCLTRPCSSPLLALQSDPFPWTDVLWLAAVAAVFAFLMAWQVR